MAGQATPAGWLARGTYVITATTVTGAVCAVSVGIGCVIGGLSFGSLSGVVWEATAKREKKNYPCSALKGAVAGGIGKTAEGLTGFVGGQAAKQLVPCG